MADTEKLTPYLWRNGNYYLHWCKGCGYGHTYEVPRWNFNGSIDKPSFTPSMRIYIPAHSDEDGNHPEETTCHYFVTDGSIAYCGDSGHELAGKTVPLEPIPEDYGF